MSTPSLMLVCHGSPDPRYLPAFEHFVACCQAGLNCPVYSGILESTRIPLSEQIAQVARRDPELVVIPLFMGRSGHVNQDIPQAIAQSGCTNIRLVPALGQHPAFQTYLSQRISAHPQIDGWILWAHGSKSGDFAPRFSRQVKQMAQSGIPALPAFYVNEPDLSTQLDVLIAQGCHQIGILPLLLFPGGLIDQLEAIAQAKRSSKIGIQILPHLAADPGLVAVIQAVANTALP
jgi:sirohydrochlorin ferrochelatase